jgi:adenosylmethionine-8-amino-7-oxononanoate aminotransferase
MSSLHERDARVLWHPATHFKDLERLPPFPVARAKGAWLYDADGRAILDAISSWWTSIHGHGHPAIVDAIARQAAELDHVMFAGFTHEPAVALAEELLARAPAGYGKVFYSDCGSASIEVAMKLSYQSRIQRGEQGRRRFATLKNSYHGETLGALSVCGAGAYRELFAPLLVDVLELPAPSISDHEHEDLSRDTGASLPEADLACQLLEEHAHELTALFVEPLVQCAGRMSMMGAGYYRRISELARALGVHVIADEIAVAFGRTGRLFASEWSGVAPDLLCLSKGLSGGCLPLAVTLVRDGFEDDFKGDPARSFLHSHTFTGNPIACAAGLASLQLIDESRTLEGLPWRIEKMAALRRQIADECDAVVHHRQAGMIVALQVEAPPGRMPEGDRLGLALREAAFTRGVLLRPLHDTIYWMPPLNVTAEELELMAVATRDTIQTVLGG